ncbi:hypothetical protein B0I37DRAFT_432636 [Chaetomium sp. MPI-CAGE-AT-0009]|nr:hypothetical protein B0I37DRAFT_432636 [Chaetomium sp. MPI-CAGE-AT-0009]
MNREIPGFYYDTVKRKYFRIEDARTAPPAAAWSAPNVKRRAAERQDQDRLREKRRREAGRVRRGEVGRLSWPGEVVWGMWIGGDVRSGLGLAYAVDGSGPAASYIPRDAEDCINFQDAAERYPRVDFRPRYFARQNQRCVKAIKFHEPSSKMLVAWEGITAVGIKHFTPRSRDPSEPGPAWVIEGEEEGLQARDALLSDGSATAIHALQPAPAGSRLTCIAGTNAGVVQLRDDKLTWLTPPPPPPRQRNRRGSRGAGVAAPWQGDVLSVDFLQQNPTEVIVAGTRSGQVCVLDVRVPAREWSVQSNTFRHVSSAAHVRSVGDYGVLAAGPYSAMALYDVRFLRQRQQHQQQQQQQPQQHRNRHHHPPNPNANAETNPTRPIITFPHYRNDDNIHAGLDVLTAAGYGGGIVAAAHTNDVATAAAAAATPTLMWQQQQRRQNTNTNSNPLARRAAANDDDGGPRYGVVLHSLRDGTRVAGGEVDGIRAPAVVKSLMWQTLPGDRHPSLFVGEGASINKYSFWA